MKMSIFCRVFANLLKSDLSNLFNYEKAGLAHAIIFVIQKDITIKN